MVDRDHKQKKSVYVQTDEKELNEKKMIFKKSVKSIKSSENLQRVMGFKKSSDDIVDNRNHQGHKLNMKSLTSKDKDEESLFDF
ncbi:uncharacterized protein LOC117962451 isoform X4 [Acipenser ruthenus]|uniref:uncharacterized protein LOC117962451 isoform X4 n=1 Tax=Acipenser ruthenus TaxID=7906 RepID=UPI0027404ABD|nr:uncharacterized protein LOC117962451 isoform X4 [Acipenser ruthenus]